IKPHSQQRAMSKMIERGFDALRNTYDRVLGATLRNRGGVYFGWIALTLLIFPMYMFSPTELAPNEDQGVVFGAIDVPANATLEQLGPYTGEIFNIYKQVPQFDHSFQLTFPNQGFGGMLAKPWSERERSIFPIQEELAQSLATVSGVRAP